jgi:hypothetical protein
MAQVRLIDRFCQLLQSIFPVLRVPMQVHDSKDEENIFVDCIDNAIGKTTSLTAPDIVFEYRPSFWKTEDILEGGIHFNGEIVAETWLTIFIIVYSGDKLDLGFGVKNVFHLANRS